MKTLIAITIGLAAITALLAVFIIWAFITETGALGTAALLMFALTGIWIMGAATQDAIERLP